jgi:hypothetical protein
MDTETDNAYHHTSDLCMLLSSELVLDSGLHIVGTAEYPGFLCATIADKDLSWNNAEDW